MIQAVLTPSKIQINIYMFVKQNVLTERRYAILDHTKNGNDGNGLEYEKKEFGKGENFL